MAYILRRKLRNAQLQIFIYKQSAKIAPWWSWVLTTVRSRNIKCQKFFLIRNGHSKVCELNKSSFHFWMKLYMMLAWLIKSIKQLNHCNCVTQQQSQNCILKWTERNIMLFHGDLFIKYSILIGLLLHIYALKLYIQYHKEERFPFLIWWIHHLGWLLLFYFSDVVCQRDCNIQD